MCLCQCAKVCKLFDMHLEVSMTPKIAHMSILDVHIPAAFYVYAYKGTLLRYLNVNIIIILYAYTATLLLYCKCQYHDDHVDL